MTKQIPNLITLLNLLCGSIATILAVQNHLVLAALFVAIGIFFDFFDGLAARLLNAKSELGLQLDSLADMVTSGLVPGIVMVQLLNNALVSKGGFYGSWDVENHIFEYPMLSFIGLAITLASCYRLANFNVDDRQTDSFIGLPTPANALLVLSLPLILEYQPVEIFVELFTNMWFLFAFTVLSCFLLNANLELFALKFKNFKLDGNKTRFGFLLLCILLIVFLKFIAIPIIMLSYILISFFIWNIVSTYWLYYSTPFGMWFAVLVNTLLMALVFLIYYKITKRLDFKKSALFLVLLWISFEYLHLQWEFSWPWLNLGNAFAEYTSWIQWYEYTGAFGGTLWVWIGNFIVFKATLLYLKYKETKLILNGAVKLMACIGLPLLVSVIILKTHKTSTKTAEVVILQPNIDPYNEKYNITDSNIQTLLTTLAEERVTDSTALVLAPETVFADNTPLSKINYSPAYQFGKTMMSKHYKISILSGISMYDYFTESSRVTPQSNSHPKGGWFDDYNSAYMMNTSKDIQLYHKSKLVVGVENFPYQGLLKPLLGDVMLDLGGTVAMKTTQEDREAFTLNYNIKTAPIICYESIYGEFVTGYVRNGAQFLSIITNDAWWSNTQGHKQHFNYARLRAIETRRSIARSANTGISGFITETGEVLETLGYDKQGSIKGTVTLNDTMTFYVKYGDYIARTSAFVLIFLFLYAITRRRGEV